MPSPAASPDPIVDHRPSTTDWDAFVQDAPHGHFLQASAWAAVRATQGWRSRRVVLRDRGSGRILAGAQTLVRGRPGLRMAYLPRGPVAAPEDPRLPLLAAAVYAGTADCVFTRFEPHWTDTVATRRVLENLGLREAEPVQPPSTLLLDLAPGAAALLAGMKQKWRYNIRVAERRGVSVSLVDDEAGWDRFEGLVHHTARRNAFASRPAGYYRAVARAFGPAARLYLARLEGQTLAGILVLHWGRQATYLYGGSSDLSRDAMPNHLLQWRAIQDAAAAGLDTYDFWGIPDALGLAAAAGREPDDAEAGSDGLWGVWGFKRGFGGRVWRTVGAWDHVRAPLRHALATRALPLLRRAVRRA